MFCTQCKRTLGSCECDDLEERLDELANIPNFQTNRCGSCGSYPGGCECDEYVKAGDVDGE